MRNSTHMDPFWEKHFFCSHSLNDDTDSIYFMYIAVILVFEIVYLSLKCSPFDNTSFFINSEVVVFRVVESLFNPLI